MIQEDFVRGSGRALCGEGITFALLVPAMIQACLVMVPDVGQRDVRSAAALLYGASPIAEQTLRRALEVFGCEFVQGYGMTETTAAVTYLLPEDHRRALRGESPSCCCPPAARCPARRYASSTSTTGAAERRDR